MEGQYRILPHTADFAFEVKAETFEALIGMAIAACSDAMWGRESLVLQESVEMVIPASDREMALFEVLSEVIYLFETRRLIAMDARVSAAEGGGWKIILLCDRFDPKRHQYRVVFKAPTLHGLKVTKARDGALRARILMDT